jgi:nucleotide-binding universal stress UspA family protein
MNSEYKNVLAALDLERSTDTALIAGSRLAREHAADLRVVSAIRRALVSHKGFFTAEMVDRASIMQEARSATELRIRSVVELPTEIDVVVGDPGEVIASVAEHRSSDLIVLCPRRRSGSEHFLGSTATDVLRWADGIDVYACHRNDPQNPTDKTIIAIDGSDVTADVLADSARFLSPAVDSSSVHVICIVPAESGRRHERVLDNCRRYLENSPWGDMEVRVENKDVANTLNDAIREHDADLLVIGSGENLGIGWAIGSTTNDVLHDVSCDVLVVRP